MNQTVTDTIGEMYYQYMSNPQPTANVTIKRNRVKQYGDNIYLANNTNFEIELWNPKSTRVLAKIMLNGENVSGGGIVLNPGQRVYLERYVDVDRKFLFTTYEAEDSKAGRKAIQNNGDVNVSFYDEVWHQVWMNSSSITFDHSQPFTYTNGTGSPIYGGCTTSNFMCQDMSFGPTLDGLESVQSKSIETGRVEKGEKSNQDLDETFGNFSDFACTSYFVKILPKSQQPTPATEIRSYCTQCGRKWKRGENFCPKCGTPNK